MSDSFERMTAKRSAKSMIIMLFILALIGAGVFVFFKYYEREMPHIAFHGDISVFGQKKELQFSVADARSGISLVELMLIQGDKSKKIFSRNFSRQGFFEHNGPNKLEETVTLETRDLGLSDGKAELQATVRDFSFWNWMAGNETVMKYPVVLDTKPPKITILHSTRYVSQGGSGMVLYKIDDPAEKHGVTINGHFNPGFPDSDADDERYVAFFGLPYDTEKIETAMVTATDQAGNTGIASFAIILKKQNFRQDKINISDSFLNLKIPEFSQEYTDLTGSPIEKFVFINSQVRAENSQTIVEATADPSPVRLWRGPFERMARSSRMAGYADHRTYYYHNEEIDKQVHLGIDLASTKRAEIHAANRGIVVFAKYLGIYGNTVILDHGQGIFSLYSHLSEIKAAMGEMKEKGALLGLSGNTGMAGGDHLHFSMIVNGVFVSPLEWWDPQWLQLNIDDILYGFGGKRLR